MVKTPKNPGIPEEYYRLEGSELRRAPNAEYLGTADEGERITLTIILRRRPDGPPVPDFDSFARTPPSQRRRLSNEEFAERYGAAPTEIDLVTDFAISHGLTLVETNAAQRAVVVSGTVAQMNKAFAVKLGNFRLEAAEGAGETRTAETYRGYEGYVHVPAPLAEVIVGVFGLDNRRITKRNAADPPNTAPVSLATLRQLYNFPTNSAAGQTIGIFSEGGYQTADISATFGGSPPTITDIAVDASNNGTADGETTQDICIAALAAPGAAIAVYFTTFNQKGWVDLVQRVAHPKAGDPVCSVLSSSFYVANGDDATTLATEGISVAWLNAATSAFQDAAIQGVTLCIASGDTGSNSKIGDGNAHVQYPGSDPWVLAVGGTTIGNVVGNTFDEYVWNDPNPADPTHWGTTGGGVSDFFALPSYQNGAGVPRSINDNHVGRGVPDVAANASANSGYSGLVVGGAPFVGNGTSASAPLWAGLIAVINAALGYNVGFANTTFYALGSPAFRDINPTAGPTDNSNGPAAGYPAGPGWDACTGWGSPNGRRLLAALAPAPIIATTIANGGSFGNVCPNLFSDEILTIDNSGFSLLLISNITSSAPEFAVPSVVSYPLAIEPGGAMDIVIRFHPTALGLHNATLTIFSNDLGGPHTIPVSGTTPPPKLLAAIAHNGNFGDACVGKFVDESLVLSNSGRCRLAVTNVTSSSGDFLLPTVVSYPVTIGPGDAVALPLRFEPTGFGPKSANLSVFSDDPASPLVVAVRGDAPAPRLVLAIANSGNFARTCVGSFVDEALILNNSGRCSLSINGIASSSSEFLVPQVVSYPIAIGAGGFLPLPIRFAPTSFGVKSSTLTITSNDPAGPQSIVVGGEAPSGKLAVSGSTSFGGVNACCCADRTLSICNVGDCKLHVSSVAFKRNSRHWKLINNPFPATLHPGSCLGVVIRYKATEKCPRSCELVITSDDPGTPVKVLDVLAYTIWSECGCKKCCDDCAKGSCEKRHAESCCQGYPCCDDDDEGEEC